MKRSDGERLTWRGDWQGSSAARASVAGAPLLLGSSEATRRRQVRDLLFVCCGWKDEEEDTQGGARARWIGEKEEVGEDLDREEGGSGWLGDGIEGD